MVALFDHEASQSLRSRVNRQRYLSSGVRPCGNGLAPGVGVLTSLVGGIGFAPFWRSKQERQSLWPIKAHGHGRRSIYARGPAREAKTSRSTQAFRDFQCVQGQWESRTTLFPPLSGVFPRLPAALFISAGQSVKVTVARSPQAPHLENGTQNTIDCATLMNKGFESIEIMNLFGLKRSK